MLADRHSGIVAVVEDDAVERRALGRVLQLGGFEPALFDSAESFLATRPGGGLLCVIIDVQLPGMSGTDLQHRLRSEQSKVPIIVTTGNRSNAVRERAELAGCRAFLPKPVSATTILAVLESVAGQSEA